GAASTPAPPPTAWASPARSTVGSPRSAGTRRSSPGPGGGPRCASAGPERPERPAAHDRPTSPIVTCLVSVVWWPAPTAADAATGPGGDEMGPSGSSSPRTPTVPRGGRIGGAVAVVVAVLVALVVPSSRAEAAGRRFIDPVFPSAVVTPDLVYGTATHKGQPFDLKLDVYEPTGDTAERRPLMVWIHGGAFQQ